MRAGKAIVPNSARDLAGDEPEQRRLAGAVAADEARAAATRQKDARMVEQQPVAEAVGEIVDGEHGRTPSNRPRRSIARRISDRPVVRAAQTDRVKMALRLLDRKQGKGRKGTQGVST